MVSPYEDPIELVPSRFEQWREQFEAERTRIRSALTNVDFLREVQRIEHVGSTAVPELAAKDIVDLDVVVDDDAVGDVSRALKCELGGTRMENTDEWHPLFKIHDGQRFNVHVFAWNSDKWRVSVATKEVLCERADLRRAYERHKREMAADHDDLVDYSEGKGEMIEQILDAVREGYVSVPFDIPDRSESGA